LTNQKSSPKTWIIREYTEKDRSGVFNLRKAVYGEPFRENEWNWKFINKYAGRSSRIFVAESDGLIVGVRPIICSPLKSRKQYVISGLDVDMMVHPDFRNLGIFTGLVRESIKTVQSEGVDIILSFPNENSYPGLKRSKNIKWQHVNTVPLLAMPLNFDKLSKRLTKNWLLQRIGSLTGKLIFSLIRVFGVRRRDNTNDITINRVRTFDQRFDGLWQTASDQFNLAIRRDSNYLQWRYGEKPDVEYAIFSAEKDNKLAGYIVLKISQELLNLNLGLIVDMLTVQDDQVIKALLAKAVAYFKEKKADAIGCIMLPYTGYYKALKRQGFMAIPNRFSPKQFYFMVYTAQNRISDEMAGNAGNWFITFGDIDIV